MEDIFTWVREGNAFQVRMWLDNTENDLNQGDDHQFSLLHWASREGRTNICEMLINRGARINATNMGDDTALHLAAAHGHYDTVVMLLNNKANINSVNEHGNTPLHYACFWRYAEIAEHLVNNGALVGMANEFGSTALEKTQPHLAKLLKERAASLGQDLRKIPFQDRSWLGYQTRSRDATLSRHSGISFEHLRLNTRVISSKTAEIWKGKWQKTDVVAKMLNRVCTDRNLRDFKEECPRLRIFNHPNVLPVLGGCMEPRSRALVIVSQWMKFGTLYDVLHGETNIVVDQNQALRFALDIARGMEFLHSLDPMIPQMNLNSKHVMIDEDLAKINVDDPKYQMKGQNGGVINGIDEDLTAKINMGDYKFTFHDAGREFNPAWLSPEALQRKPEDINQRASDMWSYAVLLWELATREVPFADMSPMETGMKVALEGLRVTIPPGTSSHLSRLINICMNEDPGKRPRFDMVIPILEKMKAAG